MANRIPLVFDTTQNKIKELPSGDNLNLSSSSIVDAVNINATGTITANTLTVTNLNAAGGSIAAVALSNDYNDLDNLPTLFSGRYEDLTGAPTAISADWADITGKPTIPTKISQLVNDTSFITNSSVAITTDNITNLAQVAKSNDYNDLDNRITAVSQLTNDSNYITAEDVAGGTLTVEVNNTGNLEGSVFGSDSTVIIDHLNNTVNLTGGPVSGETTIGSTGSRFNNVYLNGEIDLDGPIISGNSEKTVGVTGLTLKPTGAKLDLMRDYLEQLETAADAAYTTWQQLNPGPAKDSFYTSEYLPKAAAVADYQTFINDAKTIVSYDPDNAVVVSEVPFSGSFKGDLIGSVFADDSNMVIDGLTGTVYGVFDGDLHGSVFADDSTPIVDGQNKNIDAVNVYATTHWGDLKKNGSILSVTANSGIQLLPNGVFNIPNATTIDIDASDTIDITATNNLTITSSSGTVTVDGYISIADLKTLVAAAGTYGDFQAAIAAL